MDLSEIFDYAIDQEIKAMEFYERSAAQVENVEAASLFRSLARMEAAHRRALENEKSVLADLGELPRKQHPATSANHRPPFPRAAETKQSTCWRLLPLQLPADDGEEMRVSTKAWGTDSKYGDGPRQQPSRPESHALQPGKSPMVVSACIDRSFASHHFTASRSSGAAPLNRGWVPVEEIVVGAPSPDREKPAWQHAVRLCPGGPAPVVPSRQQLITLRWAAQSHKRAA